MRLLSFLCMVVLCGCGTSTNLPATRPVKANSTNSTSNSFVGRAKAYVSLARHDIDVLKKETDKDKLLSLKAELTKAHSELQQPDPDSEKQRDLQRYLENIAINFGVAVDFQIELLALEPSADEEKKKAAKDDAEMMMNGTPKICDQADEILNTL